MRNYQETVLKNGLRVISCERSDSPIAAVSLWIKAGSRYESKKDSGYAHILEHMLFEGTERRPTRLDVSRELDHIGAFSNAFTNREYVYFIAEAAYEHAELIYDVFSDMILRSVVAEETLENEKKVIIEELHQRKESPQFRAAVEGLKYFFGDHPLAFAPIGEEESILATTGADLKKYHKQFYVPSRAAVITSGNLNHADAIAYAEKYFGGWLGNFVEPPVTASWPSGRMRHFISKPGKQTFLMVNFPAVDARAERESDALDIVANFLSYGVTSLLRRRLRGELGLVYAIDAANIVYTDAGRFSITTSTTAPAKVAEELKKIVRELPEIFTLEKFEESRFREINVIKRVLARSEAEVGFLGNNFALYGKLVAPEKYLAGLLSVTYEEVLKTLTGYLQLDRCYVTVFGPEEITF